jgi:hypothetical protein
MGAPAILPDEFGRFVCHSLVSEQELATLTSATGLTLQPAADPGLNGHTTCVFAQRLGGFPMLLIAIVTTPTAFLAPSALRGVPVPRLGLWAYLRTTRSDTNGLGTFDIYVGGTCNQVDVTLYANPDSFGLRGGPAAVVLDVAQRVFGGVDCSRS